MGLAMELPFDRFEPLFARGRGLGHLIQGLSEGDPMSWVLLVVVVAIMIGVAVYKSQNE